MVEDRAAGPDEVAQVNEFTRLLYRAIRSLPPKHRFVLCERLKGVPYRQIAKAIGRTKTRAMQLNAAARGKIREKLAWAFAAEKTS
jgi:RNA polymerase sigma factor (sigma-70 family)